MTEGYTPVTQRLNYFHGQFLHEKDFNDEQAYHLDQQRSHSRLLHTPGIADGLMVSKTESEPPQVTVSSGIAYDAQGRRIVLDKDEALMLSESTDVYIIITYAETKTNNSSEGGVEGQTRWTESAVVTTSTSFRPEDSVLLAKVTWDADDGTFDLDEKDRLVAGVKAHDLNVEGDLNVKGMITGNIAINTIETGDLLDNAVTSVKLAEADGSSGQNTDSGSGVKTGHLQDEAVTLQKLALTVRPLVSIAGVSNPGGNIVLDSADAIVIEPDVDNNRITIGENHSAQKDNPHGTTATQVGALALSGGSLTGDLSVEGNLKVDGSISGNIVAGLEDNAVTSAKLAEADGISGQTTYSGSGVKTDHIQDYAITLQKLAPSVQPIVSIAGVFNPGGNVDLSQAGYITIVPDDANNRITIGETHSAREDNPHRTTAAQVGALPATGGVLSGNLGIGVTPAFPLDVHGRMRIRQTSASSETAGMWLTGYYRQEIDTAFFGMQSQNTVGILGNTGTPGWRLTVSLDRGDFAITGNAFKPGGGAWATPSDVRLKREVRPLNDALDRLLKLKPIAFEWKEPEKQGNLTGPQMGFLADDVEGVFPEWVGVDSQGMKTLSIRGFEALAVEALKQLKQENDQLKAALALMQEKMDALEQGRRRFSWLGSV